MRQRRNYDVVNFRNVILRIDFREKGLPSMHNRFCWSLALVKPKLGWISSNRLGHLSCWRTVVSQISKWTTMAQSRLTDPVKSWTFMNDQRNITKLSCHRWHFISTTNLVEFMNVLGEFLSNDYEQLILHNDLRVFRIFRIFRGKLKCSM